MKSNIFLILLGVLIAYAVLSIAENTEDNSLSEEASSYRLARAAKADPDKNKASKKNKKAKKKSKRNQKAKNAVKTNKKAQKANRKNKKSVKARKKNKKANRKNKKTQKARKNNKKANSNKSQKARKKNKKANRRNRKSKKSRKNRKSNKANKKDKKTKKSKKRDKKRKSKKSKKSKKKNNMNGKNSRKIKSQKNALVEVPEKCLTDAVKTLYNGVAKKALNFERQVKRIENRVPVIAKKLLKAGEYKHSSNNMANIAPSCPPGLAFEAEDLSIELGTCEKNITESCQPPEVNQAQIYDCKPLVEAFINLTKECYKLTNVEDVSGTDACDCWESKELKDLFVNLTFCVIKDSEQNVTDRFKECKNAVSSCNKEKTAAFPVFVNCSYNPIEDLEADAKLLADNINALNQAVTAVENAAAPARRRIIRAAATNCSDFIGNVEKREYLISNFKISWK